MTEQEHHLHEEEDFAGVYDGAAPQHRTLNKLENQYDAWHHPRKHWVRIHQWCASIRKLIQDLNLSESNPFHYLTLPGNELLDIRALGGVFERAQVPLRYMGFNSVGDGSDAQTELNLSRNEVSSLPWIHKFSYVEEDRLETIVKQKSQGRNRLNEFGHFHAINLDLCDSIAFRDPEDENGSALGALREIIEIQIQRSTPWLLFITTKVEPNLISDQVQQGFDSAIASNIESSQNFSDVFCDALHNKEIETKEGRDAVWGTSGETLVKLFATGLGKWLLRILVAGDIPRTLSLISACVYRSGHTTNMLSVVFRCDTPKISAIDRDGILWSESANEENEKKAELREIDLGIALVKEMSNCVDLDEKLSNEPEVGAKIIDQAARLMSSARYDADAYKIWAGDKIGEINRLRHA